MPHETQPDRIAPDARTTLDEIRRLQADRTHRDARRMFFVEGVRNVVHAIESGFHIETLVYSEKLLIVPIARRLSATDAGPAFRRSKSRPSRSAQISLTPRASGVGAIVAQRWSLPPPRFPEGRALLGPPRGHPLGRQSREPDPDLGGRRWRRLHPGGAADRPLLPRGRPRVDGGVSFVSRSSGRTTEASGTGSAATAVASSAPRPTARPTSIASTIPGRRSSSWARSARGFSPLQRGLCTDLVRIPMVGSADSLNLAVAGSLLMYEVYRTRSARRDGPPPPPLNGPGRKNSRPPAC